jgi:membrane fusion protein, copper/silver efflux system
MKKPLGSIILSVIIVGAFLAGTWLGRRKAGASAVPSVPASLNQAGEAELPSLSFGAVRITPERQQVIGIRVGLVEKKPVVHTFRILGRIAADEVRLYRVNASVDGWIQEVYPNSVGTLVKKDEVLATFYSPQFLDTQQAFIYALDAVARLETGRRLELGRKDLPAQSALDQLTVLRQVDALRNLGMSDAQIEEIGQKRLITQSVRIASPASGFVVARNVSPGQRFEKGTELFQIADLSRVWVLADVFEHEVQYFKPGVKATFGLPQAQKIYQATVSPVLPIFDASTRTLKVRLETDNPGYLLKPDMFVNLELPVNFGPTITVPADAVLYSGLRKTVFIDRGNGYFEPRRVETGRRLGDRVEIVEGLSPGERIVVSGNFFIDSENKLQTSAQGIYGALSIDPVCGLEVDEARARSNGMASVYEGKTYYFCSPECKKRFDEDPAQFVHKVAHPEEDATKDSRPDSPHD